MILGIDIGGTNTKLGLTDLNGNIFSMTSIATQGNGSADTYLAALCAEIDKLIAQLPEGKSLKGIGVGAPGAHPLTGKIEAAANMPWANNMDIKGSLESFYQVPVRLDNDANAATIGEMKFGAARGLENFIVITLGTGLGSGIVAHGKMIYGATGMAGEIGHAVAVRGGRKCNCGKRGCLETYVSGRGLRRTVMELMAEEASFDSDLFGMSFQELDAHKVAIAANKGDAFAQKAFQNTGYMLGACLADAVVYTQPEAIFLAGGLTAAGDLLMNPVQEAFNTELLSLYQGKVKISYSGLPPNDAAILGAASLVLYDQESDIASLDEMAFKYVKK